MEIMFAISSEVYLQVQTQLSIVYLKEQDMIETQAHKS